MRTSTWCADGRSEMGTEWETASGRGDEGKGSADWIMAVCVFGIAMLCCGAKQGCLMILGLRVSKWEYVCDREKDVERDSQRLAGSVVGSKRTLANSLYKALYKPSTLSFLYVPLERSIIKIYPYTLGDPIPTSGISPGYAYPVVMA